jgi:probable addiction module antidote protein
MKKRIKVADQPEFDAAPYLDSEAAVAAYLTDVIEANDASLLAAALGDIARARGMTEIAKSAGITREALYKALRPETGLDPTSWTPGERGPQWGPGRPQVAGVWTWLVD